MTAGNISGYCSPKPEPPPLFWFRARSRRVNGSSAASSIARSGLANNRQLHRTEADLIRDNAQDFAKVLGLCNATDPCTEADVEKATGVLTMEALSKVDVAFSYAGGNSLASNFLATLGQGEVIVGTDQTLFKASGVQYKNSALNANYLLDNQDILDFATLYGGGPYDNVVDAFTTAIAAVNQDQSYAPEDVEVLKTQLGQLSADEFKDLATAILYNNGEDATAISINATALLLQAAEGNLDLVTATRDALVDASGKRSVDRAAFQETTRGVLEKLASGQPLTVDEKWFVATLGAGAGAAAVAGTIKGFGKLANSNAFARVRAGLGLPPKNLTVKGLSDITDVTLDPDVMRNTISGNLKSRVDSNDVSVATASVRVNGSTEYFVSVSGKSYSGTAPDTVTIGNRTYRVVRTDSLSVEPVKIGTNPDGSSRTNKNHAEQKLFSYFKDNYLGENIEVNIGVQNTSPINPGVCQGCVSTSNGFAFDNTTFIINIFQGTTNP